MGNIYKGEVCRVLPGMQAAFVDIGLDKAAFLHLSDFNSQELQGGSENIEHYLKEGQKIVVQVTKDPLGNKGARLTTDISVPSRFQVYMPYAINSGVSQRIESEEERIRLRTCIEGYLQKHTVPGGFIAYCGRMRGGSHSLFRYDFFVQTLGIDSRKKPKNQGQISDSRRLTA